AEDYYEMQAFFSGVTYGDVSIKNPNADRELTETLAKLDPIEKQVSALFAKIKPEQKRPAVSTVANVESFEPVTTKKVRFTIESSIFDNRRQPCIDEFEIFDTAGRNVALSRRGAKVTASGSNISPNRHELKLVNDGTYGNSSSWMSNEHGKGWLQFEFPAAAEIERVVWGRDRQAKFDDRLADTYRLEYSDSEGNWKLLTDSSSRAAFDPENVKRNPFAAENFESNKEPIVERAKILGKLASIANGTPIFSGKFKEPEPQYLLLRGDPEQPQQEVQPAFFSLQSKPETKLDPSDEPSRRMEIANWIASPENPLTARVMVNRIWQWHFGVAIVNTPNDFGNSGAEPSHPQLLDWLASEFIRSGWSLKKLHRQIVMSATYRQSNFVHAEGLKADAGNQFLWRFPSRRLEGEAIRDSMLALSGRLNRKTGGPGFDLFKSRGGLSGFPPVEDFSDEGRRRLIYAHKIRMEREIVFGAFDCPDAGQSTPARKRSTTPIQALNLFNSHFTAEESASLAARLRAEAGDDVSAQIDLLWMLVFSRSPDPETKSDAETLVREHGLESLCRAVYNSNELLFMP
ncbi:MAG: DUF1553 domain-containing protein, partial [Verrucomicrobiota bacterium]